MTTNENETHADPHQLPVNENGIRELIGNSGPREEVPAEILAEIRSVTREEWIGMAAAHARRRKGQVRAILALAASLAVVLLVGWWWRSIEAGRTFELVASVERAEGSLRLKVPRGWTRESDIHTESGEMLPVGTILSTSAERDEPGGYLALRLVGGQGVRLDAGTKVRLVSLTGLELERGAVYLDSGPDPPTAAAVEISTAHGVVTEVGSQFEVRIARDKRDGLLVRVREGAISIARGDQVHAAGAGEELSLRRDGSLERRHVDPYGAEWDWLRQVTPSLQIEGLPLATFLEWVDCESGREIRFATEELGLVASEILLHGSIEGLSPEQALDVVLPGSGMDYRVEDGTIRISAGTNGGEGG